MARRELRRGEMHEGRGMVKSLCALSLLVAAPAAAQASTITVHANELGNTATILPFTYLVNVDNARDPHAGNVLDRTGVAPTQSNSPIVAEGDQSSNTTPDLAPGRYLVSVRSPDHQLWGKHVTVPATGNTDVTVSLRKTPLPLGKIRVFVFADDAWTNGAPDTEEAGLAGFHVTLDEQTDSQVSVDYFNHPLCGGECVTESDGFVE